MKSNKYTIINCFAIILICIAFLLPSCSQERNKKTVNEQESMDIDSADVITSKDTKNEIREKLKKGARLDKHEFGELNLYDEYFKDEITKFFMKDKDGDVILSVVVYDNKLRYMKMLLQHVGDTSKVNKDKHLHRIKETFEKAIKDGEYKRFEKNYLKGDQNNDPFYLTVLLNENKQTGSQNYWTLMAPEKELKYLKYMVNSYHRVSGLESQFIINN